MRSWGIRLALFTLGVWSGSAAAQATDGAVAARLVADVVAPLERALATSGARGISMRVPAAEDVVLEGVQDRIGNFLYERGYQIHTLSDGVDSPEGVALLDMTVDVAGFDYPAQRKSFLGLGRARVLRRGALGITARLDDPLDGRWLYRGAPRVVVEDWVDGNRLDELRGDRPVWMDERPLESLETSSEWWERGILAGLVAGVIILYRDGTQ